MKRQLMSTLVAIAISSGVYTAANAQVSAGLRAGINLANMVEEGGDFDHELKAGAAVGAFMEIPVVKFLSIQPELWYSQKGYKTSGNVFGNGYSYKANLNYLDVPLMLKLKPTQEFGIVAGPQFSWLVSSGYKFETGNGSFEQSFDEDNSNLRNNLLGGVIGLEYSAGHFVAGARYSLDFQENDEDGNTNTPRFKNQVIGFSLGYRF